MRMLLTLLLLATVPLVHARRHRYGHGCRGDMHSKSPFSGRSVVRSSAVAERTALRQAKREQSESQHESSKEAPEQNASELESLAEHSNAPVANLSGKRLNHARLMTSKELMDDADVEAATTPGPKKVAIDGETRQRTR